MTALSSADADLRDLARGGAALLDAETGEATGLTLERFLGSGGMASVFLAQRDRGHRSAQLSPLTPDRVAVKVVKPGMDAELRRLNLSSADLFRKELVALGRVMERRPPTEFVIGLYGSGATLIDLGRGPVRLPWLALEYVDGGRDGSTLRDRVERIADGVDPVRALRLARGICAGVEVLHEVGILHRDLKPDNVFVSGPLDDETPKVADCGIARVEGVSMGTIAALTPSYGGPEQIISGMVPTVRNPLVGPWTDVHALSAVLWYLLGGEDWCRSGADTAWHSGARRSLRTASRLHRGFLNDLELLDALDRALAHGAAHRLPPEAGAAEGAADFIELARARYQLSAVRGPERLASVAALASAVLPLLERAAEAWVARGAREQQPATVFRATVIASSRDTGDDLLATVHECAEPSFVGTDAPPPGSIAPGAAVFQPDGAVLARFDDRLYYLVGERAHRVSVPAAFAAAVGTARWVVRGPGGGFALVAPDRVLTIRGGQFRELELPRRPPRPGGTLVEVGPISAVIGDGRLFGVVTAGVEASDDEPEFWRNDGAGWRGPTTVPLGGDVHAVASGPYGVLVVGSKAGRRARALAIGLDERITLYAAGMGERPPLTVCGCGALREAWGVGRGAIVVFDGAAAHDEEGALDEVPVALGLDLVGIPWLVTERSVLRRFEGHPTRWRRQYHRQHGPALVSIGFTPAGARVLDARGGGVRLVPPDIASWRGAAG